MSYHFNSYDRRSDRDRINEEDVPESKHAVFIRGLPGNMTTEEVKTFFEEKVGPCSFDFTKVSQDRSRLFVAVRFETRDDAKEVIARYKNDEILGYQCEVSWFRDIRRFASYQAAQGGPRHGSGYNVNRSGGRNRYTQRYNGNRSFDNRNGYDRRRRRSNSRSSRKSRSASRTSSRSKSKSKSRSRSGSSHGSRSRSRSSSHASRNSKASRESSTERDRKRSSRRDKKRTHKDKKRTRTHSRDSSPASDTEAASKPTNEEKVRDTRRSRSPSNRSSPKVSGPPTRTVVIQRDRSESPSEIPAPILKEDIKIKLKTPTTASLVQNTTFKVKLDDDESPQRFVRTMSPKSMSISPVENENPSKPPVLPSLLPPPPLPPSFKAETTPEPAPRRGKFRPIETERVSSPPPTKKHHRETIPLPPVEKETSPEPATPKAPDTPPPPKELNPTTTPANTPVDSPPRQPNSVKIDRVTPSARPMKVNKFPVTSKLFFDLRQYQANLISSVKANQSEEEGGLHLSSLTTLSDVDEETAKLVAREQALASLDEMQLERLAVKKKQLEQQFKNDCNVHAIVVKNLLKKDPSLEKQIRIALLEQMDDLEKQMMEKLDAVVDTLL